VQFIQEHRGATIEAIVYPILIVAIMWSVFLVERLSGLQFFPYGVLPQTLEGLKGVIFMPFIHGQKDFSHIINNSIPVLLLLSTFIYFYRKIAGVVLLSLWLGVGGLLWLLTPYSGSYHIGASGIIYGLFGFLLVSGFFRRYLPLQAISLFVVFIYGSLIWGIFPSEPGISWQGHMIGFLVGCFLAYYFRKEGPVPPKYRYEIEREMGLESPDLESIWWENQRRIIEQHQQRLISIEEGQQQNSTEEPSVKINYHYKPNLKPEEKNDDEVSRSRD
jgi:membrane associated rhomboid family serine protease